ncbi:MAG: AAA family ATPase, partial [Myxococcales bacterium]|nr:AAA family ATPase [Myxococcales bacterium]
MMIIEGIDIEGFGQYERFSLSGLRPGLVVVHGPNESGKSTLRRFVQWAVFGPRRGERAQLQNRHGHLAGALRVRDARGAAILSRAQDVELRLAGGGVLSGDDEVRGRLLAGLERELYDAVFTFDLFDLQRIEELRGDRVQHLLAIGALFGSGRNPVDILRELKREGEGIWRKRAQDVRVRVADQAVKRARAALAKAREEAVGYTLLDERVAALTASIDAARRERDRLDDARRDARRVAKSVPAWQTWRALTADLAETVGDLTPLPLETRERVSRAQGEAEAARARACEAADDLASAREARAAVVVDEALLAQAAEI